MARMEFTDMVLPTKLGDTTNDYQIWKAAVAKIRDLPEYKLRKLWKKNFSPADIAADKHWEVFPVKDPVVRQEAHMAKRQAREGRRGPSLNLLSIQILFAEALRPEAL